MSLKDLLNRKSKDSNLISEEDLNNNEFYVEEPDKKKHYSKFRYVDKRKLATYGIIGVIVLILLILFIRLPSEKKEDIFDIGNLLNQVSPEKSEEQMAIHSLILRNSAWGSSMDDVAIEERGNLIDYGDDYLTCDYETLFGLTWLPTYLFKNNKLIAILYEANLSLSNLDELASLHQDVAVNIHYVYEQLYRENNKWATGQARKYDENLWTKSILNGKLTMQSVWNSSNEKIFLVTNNKPLFGFLQKIRGTTAKAYMAFIIVSDDFLLTDDFNSLMNIKPSNKAFGDSYNTNNGGVIELVPADEVEVNSQVDSTTNYTGLSKPDNLSDEEFEAILNELYGNNEDGTRVDINGNIIDANGNIIGKINGGNGGGTTMTSPGVPSDSTNSSNGNSNNSSGNGSNGSGNNSGGSNWTDNNSSGNSNNQSTGNNNNQGNNQSGGGGTSSSVGDYLTDDEFTYDPSFDRPNLSFDDSDVRQNLEENE